MKKIFTGITALALLALQAPQAAGETIMPKARGARNGAVASLPSVNARKALRPMAKAASNVSIPEMNGNVLWPTQSPHYLQMCSLPTEAGADLVSLSPSGMSSNGGGILVGDTYWSVSILSGEGYEEYILFGYDGKTWEQTDYEVLTSPALAATDVALDPITGEVYGCFYSDDATGAVFGKVNYLTRTRTQICPLEYSWSACGFTSDGTLYAIDYYGKLFKVDKISGEMTEIGETGLVSPYLTSGCIDTHSDRMFYCHAAADDRTFLYEINLADATPTLLYQFPLDEEIVGMYVCPPRAEYTAPADIKDLNITFEGGSLTGTVSFVAPTLTYEGKPLEGELDYLVLAGDELELAEGKTTPGATVTCTVTLPESGLYLFNVGVSNANGDGPATERSLFVGNDTPLAPKVTAVNNSGSITLNWNAVTAGANGGYVDAAGMTYTVTRLTDNKVIAEGLAELTFTDTPEWPEELTVFTYAVQAVAQGIASEAGVSNPISLGPVTPPYMMDFEDEGAYSGLTIIDANNDGNAWYRFRELSGTNYVGRIRYNTTKAMDDWIITPGLKLEAGKVYQFHIDALREGKNDIEALEVKAGAGNTPADMTIQVVKPTDVNWDMDTWRTLHGSIEPAEDGIYYIGVHGISPKNCYWLRVDNIEVEAGATASAPDIVSDFTVKPGSYGRHEAEISFMLPTVSFDGNRLTTITKAEITRDEEVIHTEENLQPGALVFFIDTTVDAGLHTYSARAYNASGAGKPAYQTVFIGSKAPEAPTAVSFSEPETPGKVVVNWTAPRNDVEGSTLNPAAISYDVIRVTPEGMGYVAEGLKTTSFTDQPVAAGEQNFVAYAIIALTEGGESAPGISAILPVGTPYTLPFRESFANGAISSLLTTDSPSESVEWTIMNDTSFGDLIKSQDGDNGYIAMRGQYLEDYADLQTGKFDLTGTTEPVFEFYTFNMCGSQAGANTNTLEVFANDGTGFRNLATVVLNTTGEDNQWNKVTVPLTSCVNAHPSLKVRATVNQMVYNLIDNMQVHEASDGIDAAAADMADAIVITGEQGCINIAGCQGAEISIAAIDGRVIFATAEAGAKLSVPASAGIYAVKAGSVTVKVIVK